MDKVILPAGGGNAIGSDRPAPTGEDSAISIGINSRLTYSCPLVEYEPDSTSMTPRSNLQGACLFLNGGRLKSEERGR